MPRVFQNCRVRWANGGVREGMAGVPCLQGSATRLAFDFKLTEFPALTPGSKAGLEFCLAGV